MRNEKGQFVKGVYQGAGFKKGHQTWNKGGKWTLEQREKQIKARKGKHYSPGTEFKKGSNVGNENVMWRGEEAGYVSKHVWVKKHLGSPESCSNCDKPNKPGIDGRSTIQWANADHEYSRNEDDYIPLCPSCHKYYDQGLRQDS